MITKTFCDQTCPSSYSEEYFLLREKDYLERNKKGKSLPQQANYCYCTVVYPSWDQPSDKMFSLVYHATNNHRSMNNFCTLSHTTPAFTFSVF